MSSDKINLNSIHLPKWPAFVVVGGKVTEDQAKEVIIRTTSFWFSSNDSEFEKDLYSYLGINADPYPDSEDLDKVKKDLRVIDLEYLYNSRILSSYIGGPHGWINWDGVVGCNSYNIGKWPSAADIYDEWSDIAKAFPFLKLSCQLYSGESGQEDSSPVIQFDIGDGNVVASIPKKELSVVSSLDTSSFVSLFKEGRERGCSLGQFMNAVDYVCLRKYDLSLNEKVIRECLNDFASYVATCKKNNQDEWMEGLAENLNKALDVLGECHKKLKYNGDSIK